MKKIILFTLSLFCIMSLQGQTVTVDALCLGGAVNFDLNGMDGTGRNVYSNNDFQLDVRYNAGAMRWEVIGQGGVMDVFYATGTNTFSPNPPDSGTTPWMLVFDGCPLGDTTVTGDGTQSTPGGDPCMDLGG